MGIGTASGAMTTEEIVALNRAAHVLLVVGPGRRRPDRHRPRRGRLAVHARRPADPRLQQPADVGQHRPRRPARHRRHHRAGDQAPVRPAARSRPRSAARLGQKLAEILPGDMDKVFFTLGGAEAIENAIKLARHVTGRYKVLARYRAYHGATHGRDDPDRRPAPLGRTSRASSASSATRTRIAGARRSPVPWRRALQGLEDVIRYEGPHTIAAIFLETIVGHERHPDPARRLHRRASARSATATAS